MAAGNNAPWAYLIMSQAVAMAASTYRPPAAIPRARTGPSDTCPVECTPIPEGGYFMVAAADLGYQPIGFAYNTTISIGAACIIPSNCFQEADCYGDTRNGIINGCPDWDWDWDWNACRAEVPAVGEDPMGSCFCQQDIGKPQTLACQNVNQYPPANPCPKLGAVPHDRSNSLEHRLIKLLFHLNALNNQPGWPQMRPL